MMNERTEANETIRRELEVAMILSRGRRMMTILEDRALTADQRLEVLGYLSCGVSLQTEERFESLSEAAQGALLEITR